ncbi:ABC transporter permease [Peptacetobacter hominis]|uniref:ABC transporter permease n=1 Tax=Peptacetobacter hominis TaxID=2743610 RepID=A0A544QX35_9FIRM|nr:FtsX-like permease family protein [Peptacetobacter hominis]TQQ85258.1 ABC transporter permease [Peptacetobacter hominis]
MKVKNKQCIRNLSFKQFKFSRNRNIVAAFAIALTTILFTSLFTIAVSINDGFQQYNFRQCGGWNHGTFKYLTEEQFNELKTDSLIKEWGMRRFVGMPKEIPFNKSHVEIGYSDANQAHFMYCDPIKGRLPKEGTNEAATDTKVLQLLGIKPELGKQFTVTFDVDGHTVTETFTLCGWWEYDEAIIANHILIPQSRAEKIYSEVGLIPGYAKDGMTGTWNLDVMFKNSININKNIKQVLHNHGYQNEKKADNYISTGENWGYSSSQFFENADPVTLMGIIAIISIIIFTGYLIIYNVFQISVVNDIRFYGLLKTIGTTPKQIKKIIIYQAMMICIIGIPVGLVVGWFIGSALTPIIISQLDSIINTVSINPVIFIASTLFALFTVIISCRRPGKIAAKVSPIEAVKYTEVNNIRKKSKKSRGKVSLTSMAMSNLGRNKGKTIITILSLSLAVILLNFTVIFTKSFNMDKYLSNFVATDFIVADSSYFQSEGFFDTDASLDTDSIDDISSLDGITGKGKVYGKTSPIYQFITEDYYRKFNSSWLSSDEIKTNLKNKQKTSDGMLVDKAQLYGMDSFILDQLKVHSGDITKLRDSNKKYIAAVYMEDDYNKLIPESNWAKLGDTVKLRYVDELEYYNPDTGEIYTDDVNLDEVPKWRERAKKYRDVEYTVAAIVTIPSALDYRYYGSNEFVLNSDNFIQDSGTDNVMYYTFNSTDKSNTEIEKFLSDYTKNQHPELDYESKESYKSEFESFRSMFVIRGGTLCFIVGVVGILNFFNAVLTSILSRKREFAMLQSVGMTGKQLRKMLIYEGIYYVIGTGFASIIITIIIGPFIGSSMENMLWFFTYNFTIIPIILLLVIFMILGLIIPIIIYHFVSKATIVERLRESE